MSKKRKISLWIAIIAIIQCLSIPCYAQNQAIAQGCSTLDGQAPLSADPLLDTAQGVILYELDTDTLVYAWQPELRVDPAGMNKIMTALLALEQGDLSSVVTVSKAALDSVGIGSVSAGLKVGEEITLEELLYCMMVGSANDAAAVIAEHIGGTQAAFVALMNQRAAELGCTDTQFMNANGLSHEQQYTTARDLAKITLAALEDPRFVTLFGAVSHTVPATNKSEERTLVTTNYLMSTETVRNQYDERVTGGKTGALSTTDRSLIATAEQGELRYLTVVMSAKGTVTGNGLSVKTFGSFEETRALLDYGFENYGKHQLLYADKVMGQFPVSGGENDVIGCPGVELTVVLPNDSTQLDVSYRCVTDQELLTAPLQGGSIIGAVEVWFRGICVGQCDLVAMYDVAKPGEESFSVIPTAEAQAKRTWTTWLLIGSIAVLVILLVIYVVLMIRHKVRMAKLERRHRLIHGQTGGKR